MWLILSSLMFFSTVAFPNQWSSEIFRKATEHQTITMSGSTFSAVGSETDEISWNDEHKLKKRSYE